MDRIKTALIVDDSKLVTAVMEATMRPHCERVIVASSVGEAKQKLAGLGPEDLVLTDIFMGDGEGFEILQALKQQKGAPPVIVCSSQATSVNQQKAIELGALAFLAKPLSAQAVLLMWGKHKRGAKVVDRAPRMRLFAHVYVQGDGEQVLAYEVHDLSRTGAFLVTHGPLPLGTALELTIVARELRASVRAKVVRVQEPAWIHVGGVGVHFDPVSEVIGVTIEEMVKRYGYTTDR